jgi:CRISPR-associated protein (TIGR02584 family)
MMDKKIKKNVLVSVTGLSPQVVTETLYGILKSDDRDGFRWPDEIKIITTKKGKLQAKLGLITNADGRERSTLEQLCYDYDKPVPKLSEQDIYVVPDANGNLVNDAKTKEDQESLANYIVKFVADLRNDKSTGQIHASIAGGRKTMTFFLGYALSLFAKDNDKLSHVLVDSEFEGLREFYYPTPETYVISGRNNNDKLDAKEATIVLAEIPFIHHRATLEKSKALKALEDVSYRDLTLSQNALSSLQDVKIEFNYKKRNIDVITSNFVKHIDFSDNPLALSFYGMISRHDKQGYHDIKRPEDTEQYLSELYLGELETLTGIRKYQHIPMVEFDIDDFYDTRIERLIKLSDDNFFKVTGLKSKEDDENIYEQFNSKLSEDELTLQELPPTLRQLADGMSPEFFSDKLTQIKEKLESVFTKEFAYALTPGQVYVKNDYSVKREFSTRNQQKQPYGLWIQSQNIHFK